MASAEELAARLDRRATPRMEYYGSYNSNTTLGHSRWNSGDADCADAAAMIRAQAARLAEADAWKQTVRTIFDDMHFKSPSVFDGDVVASRTVALIESRHREYFCGPSDSGGGRTPHTAGNATIEEQP